MPSTKSTPHGGAASTRQMLDELDALMERMLALPVNDLDDLAQEPTPRPTLSATLTVIDAPDDKEISAAALAPAIETPRAEQRLYQEPAAGEESGPDALETSTAAEFPEQPDLADHEPPASTPQYHWPDAANPEEGTPPFTPPTPAAVVQLLRRPRRSIIGWMLRPILRFNRAFDAWLERFGILGHWLRRPKGRLILGMAGLGMLTLAIAWLVRDLANWTR